MRCTARMTHFRRRLWVATRDGMCHIGGPLRPVHTRRSPDNWPARGRLHRECRAREPKCLARSHNCERPTCRGTGQNSPPCHRHHCLALERRRRIDDRVLWKPLLGEGRGRGKAAVSWCRSASKTVSCASHTLWHTGADSQPHSGVLPNGECQLHVKCGCAPPRKESQHECSKTTHTL